MTNVIIVCLIKFFFGIVPGMSPELAWTMTTLTYNVVSSLGFAKKIFSLSCERLRDTAGRVPPLALLAPEYVGRHGCHCSLSLPSFFSTTLYAPVTNQPLSFTLFPQCDANCLFLL